MLHVFFDSKTNDSKREQLLFLMQPKP